MWFFYALGAAILWGLQYSLFGQYFKSANALSYFWVSSLLFTLVLSIAQLFLRTPFPAYSTVQWGSVIAQVFCGIAANLLCFWAIQNKNASLAGFVEICYPLFIILFSFILFKDVQLLPKHYLGGGLILAGLFFISR